MDPSLELERHRACVQRKSWIQTTHQCIVTHHGTPHCVALHATLKLLYFTHIEPSLCAGREDSPGSATE